MRSRPEPESENTATDIDVQKIIRFAVMSEDALETQKSRGSDDD